VHAKSVCIIVDPNIGERLTALAGRMSIWIADTLENRAVVEEYRAWTSAPESHAQLGTVTTFVADPASSPAEWAAAIIPVIDLHHGRHSQSPPYDTVEIVGAQPDAELRAALAEYGFVELTASGDGFRAVNLDPEAFTSAN
jgi:hypothetical protein